MLVAAKQCMEIWQRLVYNAGGELELDKSSYMVMTLELKKGGEKQCTIADARDKVSLRLEKYKGLEVKLTQNEVTTAETISFSPCHTRIRHIQVYVLTCLIKNPSRKNMVFPIHENGC